jgi:hypothetical protein
MKTATKKITFNIASSFDRLYWRIQNGNFTPNENDFEALKFITEWVNREKEESITTHQLFAKAFSMLMLQNINKYNDLDFANTQINRELSYPLSHHFKMFEVHANAILFDNYCTKIGTSFNFLSTAHKNDVLEILPDDLKNELVAYWKGLIIENTGETQLKNAITEAINRYKNLD